MTINDHNYVKDGTIGRPVKHRVLQRFQARQLAHIEAPEEFASRMHYIGIYTMGLNTAQPFLSLNLNLAISTTAADIHIVTSKAALTATGQKIEIIRKIEIIK
jgi:hypothetical protein